MTRNHWLNKNQWQYVRAASAAEKAEMQAIIDEENKFQQQEPHGWDENDNDCPIVFKLEKHDSYQMQAYTPNGTMMDNSFHESFCRCGNCGEIFTYTDTGDDNDDQYCWKCNKELDGGQVF